MNSSKELNKIFTERYFTEEYLNKKRSMKDIAREHECCHSTVRYYLDKYNIKRRNFSEAQKEALKSGRHNHPTEGKEHSDLVKEKIGQSVYDKYKNAPLEKKVERINRAKKRWDLLTKEEQKGFRDLSFDTIQDCKIVGSKTEKYILDGLKTYRPNFHSNVSDDVKIDIVVEKPDTFIAIFIDGPGHFLPIWGDKVLEDRQKKDDYANKFLFVAGYAVIRVKILRKSYSKTYMKLILDKVKAVINVIKPKQFVLIEE